MISPPAAFVADAAGGGAGGGVPGGLMYCQIPERSGLPSAVLGVGPFMSCFPSAVRGTPGVLKSGHCAKTPAGTDARTATMIDNFRRIRGELHHSRAKKAT